jgi:DNA-binding MarR family transcriptional regulator/N-acetylglutamate synthase-like GNAT family acetyltransferase
MPSFTIQRVRRFNRFYTQQIGVLNQGLLESRFSLAEVRVLYELAHREQPTAVEVARELALDDGYLSRMLRGLHKQGLIARTPAQTDRRQRLLALTPRGRRVFASLNARSDEQVDTMLRELSPAEQERLIQAMGTIEELLRPDETAQPARTPYLLRPHRPGDMGWVVYRHGVLYSQEYGWDERFEALVARIVAKFIEHFDTRRERCWIAERDGENVGSVFLVKHTKTVAKLRLLLVEPRARGLGIGRRLVDECVCFARLAGYRKITLWTNSVLHAARRIYEQTGFVLVKEKPHQSFGENLVGQTWDLTL